MKNRLHPKDLKAFRENLQLEQQGVCDLCRQPFGTYRVHLDHDHQTGAVRGALHGPCNLMLGKMENAMFRKHSKAFIAGLGAYITKYEQNPRVELHPSLLTEDEKRAKTKRRIKARKNK